MRWAMVGSRCADIWACLSRANHIHDATVPKSFAAEWPRRISSTTASRPHLGHRAHHGGVPKADIAPTAIIEQSPNARCHSVPMLRSRQCVFSVNQVAARRGPMLSTYLRTIASFGPSKHHAKPAPIHSATLVNSEELFAGGRFPKSPRMRSKCSWRLRKQNNSCQASS